MSRMRYRPHHLSGTIRTLVIIGEVFQTLILVGENCLILRSNQVNINPLLEREKMNNYTLYVYVCVCVCVCTVHIAQQI